MPAFASARQGMRHFFGTRQAPSAQGAGERSAPVVVSVNQVHGTDVLMLDRSVRPDQTFPGGWDALITDQPGVMLTVSTADCVPVLIHDPIRRVVAAIHVGWRGAVAGIVPKTLEAMRRHFGADPAALQVGIGPSVGACCYEVDEPVLSRLRAGYAEWRSLIRETEPGKAMLNLRGLVHGQARFAGTREDSIHTISLCTVCHPDLFYSYRRDGTVRDTMVSGIMLSHRRGASRPQRGTR